ncbi:uncharacterized protein DUF3145 [Jatrophihabitans sp. GAS493]|uniref:DUF3145 domain-containing protein n=1 Tax=Jatrophihabitans sp. GAS493 TaxID=1907575 RepID=UPI000BB91848|nr:DUF3145 domain-containing protein [Jatrophihabitans sp. GAS493]SOD74460.1 uncharacterized protein DUF3145 [Jatrophihabitans sp. GAS493]
MTTSRAHGATASRGVVFIHCCPAAIAPHVEWALAGVLGRPDKLSWTEQPAAPGHLRAEANWMAPLGTGTRLAASLRAWPMLVFEVTEQGTADSDAERLAYVPGRGFHRSLVSANGDVMVTEERLRGLLARARTADDYTHGLQELLGTAWDAELEPYRYAGDGSPVTLLHQVV